eukprot:COSAG06_NODE_10619_length_1647_cov_75.671189_2_plen_40_part_00
MVHDDECEYGERRAHHEELDVVDQQEDHATLRQLRNKIF